MNDFYQKAKKIYKPGLLARVRAGFINHGAFPLLDGIPIWVYKHRFMLPENEIVLILGLTVYENIWLYFIDDDDSNSAAIKTVYKETPLFKSKIKGELLVDDIPYEWGVKFFYNNEIYILTNILDDPNIFKKIEVIK